MGLRSSNRGERKLRGRRPTKLQERLLESSAMGGFSKSRVCIKNPVYHDMKKEKQAND